MKLLENELEQNEEVNQKRRKQRDQETEESNVSQRDQERNPRSLFFHKATNKLSKNFQNQLFSEFWNQKLTKPEEFLVKKKQLNLVKSFVAF